MNTVIRNLLNQIFATLVIESLTKTLHYITYFVKENSQDIQIISILWQKKNIATDMNLLYRDQTFECMVSAGTVNNTG